MIRIAPLVLEEQIKGGVEVHAAPTLLVQAAMGVAA
jgi:hypothetical protein